MKAVVYMGEGRVEVADVPPPGLRRPDDAIVRVDCTSICGSDLHLLDGKTPGMRIGGVIGHEFAGTITDLGDGLTGLEEGARVLGSFLIACGSCSQCNARRFNHCVRRRALGLGRLTGDLDGAQAEYVRVPIADVNLKPLDGDLAALSFERALFCGDVLATGAYAAEVGGVGAGDLVVVIGAGPVGLFSAAAARARGAGRVFVVDLDEARVATARDLLGFEVLDPAALGDPASAIEATAGTLADVVIEAVGATSAFRSALRFARAGGRVGVIGVYGSERYDLPMGMTWIRGLEIRFAGMANVQAHWDEALRAVVAGEIDPAAIITHRLSLDDAEEGYELFRSRAALKVLMTP